MAGDLVQAFQPELPVSVEAIYGAAHSRGTCRTGGRGPSTTLARASFHRPGEDDVPMPDLAGEQEYLIHWQSAACCRQ